MVGEKIISVAIDAAVECLENEEKLEWIRNSRYLRNVFFTGMFCCLHRICDDETRKSLQFTAQYFFRFDGTEGIADDMFPSTELGKAFDEFCSIIKNSDSDTAAVPDACERLSELSKEQVSKIERRAYSARNRIDTLLDGILGYFVSKEENVKDIYQLSLRDDVRELADYLRELSLVDSMDALKLRDRLHPEDPPRFLFYGKDETQ